MRSPDTPSWGPDFNTVTDCYYAPHYRTLPEVTRHARLWLRIIDGERLPIHHLVSKGAGTVADTVEQVAGLQLGVFKHDHLGLKHAGVTAASV